MSTHQLTLTRNGPYELTFGESLPYVKLRPYVRRSDGRGFWNRYVQAGQQTEFKILLEQPSSGDVSIPLTFSGEAVYGVHYQVLSPNPVVIPAGNTEATVIVEAIDAGIYHHERRAIITASTPSGAYLRTDSNEWAADGSKEVRRQSWWLHIRPTYPAPSLEFRTSSQTIAYSAPTANVEARISEISSEDTLCYLQVTGASTADPGDYTLLDNVSGESKLITIPAGSLVGFAVLTWTGSAPPGNQTVIIRHRTGADVGRVNEGSFTESLGQHEDEDPVGLSPYAVWPTNYTWSGPNGLGLTQDDNIQAIASGVADPAGVGEAWIIAVGNGDTGTPKVRKSFNGTAVLDSEFGYSVDGYEQTPPFPLNDWITFTVYAKKPALASRVSPSFAIQIIERSGTSQPRDHMAIFEWSGTVPVLLNTKGLAEGDGIASYTIQVQDTAAWAHNDTNAVETGWYRLRLSLLPSPEIAGSVANSMLIPYHADIGAPDLTEVNKGKGVVFAWPQVELRETPQAYQPMRGQFYAPYGGAWLDLTGNWQHTLTVTP